MTDSDRCEAVVFKPGLFQLRHWEGILSTSGPQLKSRPSHFYRRRRHMKDAPLGPFEFECAQHRRTPRPSVKRIRSNALLPNPQPPTTEVPLHRAVVITAVARAYRGTSLIRNSPPQGSYSRTMPRALWESYGGGGFLGARYPCILQRVQLKYFWSETSHSKFVEASHTKFL